MKKLITAGVDEVGRGCLAGPVVSAAVIFKKRYKLKSFKRLKKKYHLKKEKKFQNILKIILIMQLELHL